MRLHAISAAFEDPDLFSASVRSVDDHADGITVTTKHDFERAKAFVMAGGDPGYRTAGERYCKRWNYQVTGLEWLVTFVRADIRLPYLRTGRPAAPRRAPARVPGLPTRMRGALGYFQDIPAVVVPKREIAARPWSPEYLEPR